MTKTATKQSALRRERLLRQFTLRRVSGGTHIGESDLSRLERGTLPAFPGWRKRLAQFYRMPECDLFPEVK